MSLGATTPITAPLAQKDESGTDGRKQIRRSDIAGPVIVMTDEALKNDLVNALDRREIEVLFQPQFACDTGALVGAEALARWQHPAAGQIGARELFAVAGRAKMVAPLSRHVIARALEEAARWPEELSLSLNITPEELSDARFAHEFAETIGEGTIAPERLVLEITEDVLLRSLEQAASALGALRALGFRTALDDFGAGFCNFRYLKELPLDAMKLDKSMVEGVPGDPKALAVLRAILALAKALELEVYAEGIENDLQRAAIIAEGCDYWQGFLRAKPMKSDEVLALAGTARGRGHG